MDKIYVEITYTHDDPKNPNRKVFPIIAIIEVDELDAEYEFIDDIILRAFKKLGAIHADMKLYMVDGRCLGHNVEFVK